MSPFKIAVCGPALCGKRTLLMHLAAMHRIRPVLFQTYTADSAHIEHRGLRVDVPLGSDTLQFHTVSGGLWNNTVWLPIIAGANALMLVLDAQAARSVHNKALVDMLSPLDCMRLAGVVIVTKTDLRAVTKLGSVDTILEESKFAHWPRYSVQKNDLTALDEAVRALHGQLTQEH